MKQIILLSFFSGIVLFNNHSYGQITTPFNDVKSMHKEEWTPHFSNDDFSIEYKFIACDPEMGYDQESVLLKIKNNTSSHLSISWHMILHYDELCRTCDLRMNTHSPLTLNQTPKNRVIAVFIVIIS